VEFYYNNGYHESLKMSPFEVLYVRKCRVPISWENPLDKIIVRPKLLKKMEHTMIHIRKNLKISQDRQKRYANSKITHQEFKLGYHVYLMVNPKRISLKMRIFSKLAPYYWGPFEVLERVGLITYRLALPPIVRDHNLFHVSFLNKYVHDYNHFIEWILIQVDLEGEFQPKPQCISRRIETMLWN